jgi:hypothetical protein
MIDVYGLLVCIGSRQQLLDNCDTAGDRCVAVFKQDECAEVQLLDQAWRSACHLQYWSGSNSLGLHVCTCVL